MNKILVLMSTYNGEKYVDLQVKSVLNQKQVSVKLYIRDDGSKDKTVDIIKSFKDDRITIFEGRNKGARDSFFESIESAPLDFDYYAFCDQDDYWEDDKLFCAVYKLLAAKVVRALLKPFSLDSLYKNASKVARRYDGRKDNYIFNFCSAINEKSLCHASCLEDVIYAKFENKEFLIPKEYDEVLRVEYGDYMQLPPEEDRVPHHRLTELKL